MPTTIKIKNGSGAPTSSDLVQGELAIDLTNKRLYTEDGSANILELGTSPSTIDINAGTIDGVTLGTNSAVTEAQIDNININGNTIISTDTNGNIAITPNGTGEVDISKVDIDGGTIDGTVIGGASAAAGTFTSITGTGLTVDGNIKLDGNGRTLQVDKNASGTDNVLYYDNTVSTNDLFIGRDSSNLRLRTSAQNRMAISSGGDISFYEDTGTTPKLFWDASAESLGIGTTSPENGYSLTVNSGTSNGVFYGESTDAAAIIALADSSGSTRIIADNGGIRFTVDGDASTPGTNDSEAMRIDSSGNVGIGTASPSAGAPGGTVVHVQNSGGTASVRVDRSDAATAGTLSMTSGNTTNGVYGTGAKPMTFSTDSTERMRIDSSGNVGIGTSSPVANLHIESATPTIHLKDTGGTNQATKLFHNGGYFWITRTNDASSTNYNDFVIDSSGNVGVGTASPSSTLHISDSASQISIQGTAGTGTTHQIYTGGTNSEALNITSGSTSGNAIYHQSSSHIFRNQTGATEYARIDSSGNLLVGTTATSPGYGANTAGSAHRADGQIHVSSPNLSSFNKMTSTGTLISFRYADAGVGSISVTASATTYNTSSDERLKENIQDADLAGSVIDDIQVRQFDWKVNGEHQRYGMIAQELNTVAPEAVTQGETEDDMWAVDYSKLVPMLVKEIQDLRKRVADLEGN